MEKAFRINNFDLIRIIAATQVLIIHTIDHLYITKSIWSNFLYYFPGVPIFYVTSGYLISASYERSNNLKTYFQNRFLRIYPGLWVCIFFTIIVASLLGFNFVSVRAFVWLICQMIGLIYTPEFLANFGFGSYNGSLWTIIVELQFYIVLPLVYVIIGRKKISNSVLFCIFFLFVIIAITTKLFLTGLATDHESKIEKLVRYSFVPHFYLFLAGVIMQRLKFYKANWVNGKGLYWILIYIAFKFSISLLNIPALSIVSLLLLSICVISVAYTNTTLSHKFLNGNDISFGVYIYHGLLVNILISFNLLNEPFYLLIILIGAYLLGYFSWIMIEKPFLYRKKHTINNISSSILPAESSISESGAGV